MKDIKQCSISSVAFTLEVDAYDTLHNYIESIRGRYLDNPDGEEIVADIEARIAELILAVHSNDRVVAKPLIDNIIQQLGTANDICSDDPQSQDDEPTDEPTDKKKHRRRLYRNIDDAPIGGVCSGIAAYIGCDTAIVRLITLLLFIFGGTSFWVYIILWIVMPAAMTASQKLEMRGEPITASSIKDYYNTIANNKKSQSVISSILSGIGRVIMVFIKIFVVLILAILLITLIAIIVSLFAMFLTFGSLGGWLYLSISVMALISVAMLLCLGIYAAMQIINSRKIKGSVVLATLIVWLLLTLATASIAVANRSELHNTPVQVLIDAFTSHNVSINL